MWSAVSTGLRPGRRGVLYDYEYVSLLYRVSRRTAKTPSSKNVVLLPWLRSPIATDAAVVAAFSWRELFSILWQSDGANK